MGTHLPSKTGDDPGPRQLPRSDAVDGELSPTVVNDLLANQRRRYALYYLLGSDTAASVEEITEQVAVWETETRPADIPDELYERVHISMVHRHLPKLVDAGAVEHDGDSDLVTMVEGLELLTVELYLAAEREHRAR